MLIHWGLGWPTVSLQELVYLLLLNTLTGNWQQAVYNLSKTQVQDLTGRRGGNVQGHRHHGQTTCDQMVHQGCEAAGPHHHRDTRGRLRHAVWRWLDRVRLLPGGERQRKEGQSGGDGGSVLRGLYMHAVFLLPLSPSLGPHDDPLLIIYLRSSLKLASYEPLLHRGS